MDILVKENRLPLYSGDFMLVSEVEEIKQHIVAALNTFYTDWLLNFKKGIDYVQGLRHQEFLEHDIRNQIEGVDGVSAIINLSLELDKKNAVWNVKVGIKTVYGKIEINEVISQ